MCSSSSRTISVFQRVNCIEINNAPQCGHVKWIQLGTNHYFGTAYSSSVFQRVKSIEIIKAFNCGHMKWLKLWTNHYFSTDHSETMAVM